MTLEIECPRPVRSLKRVLEETYPGGAFESKHPRVSSPPSLPRVHHQNSFPSSTPSCPKFAKPRIESFEDSHSIHAPTAKHCLPLSSTSSRVNDWLSKVPYPGSSPITRSISHPSSAPPHFSGLEAPEAIDTHTYQPKLEANIQMSQLQRHSPGQGSVASVQSSRISTSRSFYRWVIFSNGIRMDRTGAKIPKELREFVNTKILSGRTSPPLPEASVREIVKMAVDIADGAESNVWDLINTPMFPVKRREIGRGGNTEWSSDALPNDPRYLRALCAPKPDLHYGYSTGRKSDWTVKEKSVTDHPVAFPYARPARGNRFPFLAIEVKSEAMGGTLWHAENQAAGTGAHCVNAMRWLLGQAYPSATYSTTDSIAFTAAVTNTEVVFYIHYYSEEHHRFYMSHLANFLSVRSADIQGCHDLVKNIIEYGLTTRQRKTRDALEKLVPFPEDWETSRPGRTMDSTHTGSSAVKEKGRSQQESAKGAGS